MCTLATKYVYLPQKHTLFTLSIYCLLSPTRASRETTRESVTWALGWLISYEEEGEWIMQRTHAVRAKPLGGSGYVGPPEDCLRCRLRTDAPTEFWRVCNRSKYYKYEHLIAFYL